MATKNLKFYKVASLPAKCDQGDVYYVTGKGIYVCTTTAASGATEAANYTRFSFANDAAATTKGVVTLNTIKGTKVDSASAADSATTATDYAATGGIATKFSEIDGKVSAIDASVSGKTLTITKPDGTTVSFTETDTHNSHNVTFTNGTATNSTGTSVAVVTTANSSTSASNGDIAASTTRVNVPTLAVTNGLADRISANETAISALQTVNTTGMQYKGTTAAVPSSGKQGDVYKCSSAINTLGAEAGDFIVCSAATNGSTAATWDVWQANVTKDAYWDTNAPVNGNFVYADGTAGKIKDSGYNYSSFATSAQGKNSDDHIANTTVHVTAANKTAWNAKWDKVTATATSTAVTEGTVFGKYVSSLSGYTEAPVMDGKVYYKDTDTHHTAAFTINDGQATAVAAQTFSQSAAKTLAIKTSASNHLTASSVSASANSGTLTIGVGVESGYTIPSDTQITAWNAKWNATDATTTTKGIASFSASNFAVSSGAVSLVWADFA